MNKEVIIIGGGLSGLSAAIYAIQKGFRPIILEKNRYLGGRVRSFFATDIQHTIDNGQHLLSASYKETIQYLKIIGAFHKIYFQRNFNIQFIKDPIHRFTFRTFPLPAPLHFFIPLYLKKRFTRTDTGDYINFVRQNRNLSPDDLKKMTVTEWLNYSRQGTALQELLWRPLSFSILNTSPEEASAHLLNLAVSQSFLHSRKNARLGIPKDWLGNIFADPAEKYILANNGSIHHFADATKFIVEEGRIHSIVTRKQQFDAPWVICTVPPVALLDILTASAMPEFGKQIEKLGQFQYNTIMTINLFLEQQIRIHFPLAAVSSPLQWIFTHPAVEGSTGGHGYAVVVSGANNFNNLSSAEIMEMVREEFLRVLGVDIHIGGNLLQYKIIKEKRATIAQTPQSLELRLPTKTPLKNLLLAGDWTDTGLPATIESAILSGKLAVEAMVKRS